MNLENIISEEFLEEMKEYYNVKASTVTKYAKLIIEKYPFVLKDDEVFREIVEEVVSSIGGLSDQIYSDKNTTFKEKNMDFMSNMHRVINNSVKYHFEDEVPSDDFTEDRYDEEYSDNFKRPNYICNQR